MTSSSFVVPSTGQAATPMLTVTCGPSSAEPSVSTAVASRSAITRASPRATSGRRTANSSPPYR